MNDRAAPAGTPDQSPGSVIVFDRPRSSLVVSILASLLGAALVVVSALDVGLSQLLILLDQGLRGPILQDLLGRIDSGTVAVAVSGLSFLAYERYVSFRSEPQRVEIAGDQLTGVNYPGRSATIILAGGRSLVSGSPSLALSTPIATGAVGGVGNAQRFPSGCGNRSPWSDFRGPVGGSASSPSLP